MTVKARRGHFVYDSGWIIRIEWANIAVFRFWYGRMGCSAEL